MSNEHNQRTYSPGHSQMRIQEDQKFDDHEINGDPMRQSNVHSVVSHVSAPENLIKYFQKEYKQLGKCLDLTTLHKSKLLRLKKYKEAVYYGEFINGKRHGRGLMAYDNGRIYEGAWESDLKHGEGYEKFNNQCVYEGEYINGKPEGVGRYSWPNGEFYQGEWANGVKHGSGLWQGAKGDSYAGEWKFGKADGYGVHTWLNGDRYEGQFKQCLKHGDGIEKFANGDIYKGSYFNGKPSGFGEYYWKNGSYFKGNFKNGLRDGHGIWKRGPGVADKYQGEYVNDKKCGYGIFTWATGNVYKGTYASDMRNGKGEMYWNDGSYYKGQWKDGVQNGQGQIYVTGEGFKKGVFENNQLIIVEHESLFPSDQKFYPQEEFTMGNQDPEKSIASGSKNSHKNNPPSRVSFRSRGKSTQNGATNFMKSKVTKQSEEKRPASRYSKQYSSINHPPNQTVDLNHPLLPKRLNKEFKYSTIDRNVTIKPKTSKKERILHSSFYMHKIGMKNRANTSANRESGDYSTIDNNKKHDMIEQMRVFAKTKMSKDIRQAK